MTTPATVPHPGGPKGSVNYVVEHAAPSAVCLVRKIQASPYQALPLDKVLAVTVPNLLSLRPPTHIAHQALMEFYAAMDGHCGVSCPDPSSVDLQLPASPTTNSSKERSPREPSGQIVSAACDGGTGQLQHGLPVGPLAATIQQSPVLSGAEDYRLSQIRRNERHVNNATYGRVCTFFLTREGCRRGRYCNFLHIGKGGGTALP
ncbi:unnamed protein product [Trypanosoma congolense IL3000]|uniref:Uncharacterized protein TCIL3000_8_3820 n=1 Tax=Trypanosoma congolense (strain IL3000) TaxID=1068625 RepID=F9W503_TRYCI|nr:unnamed protein product [Trypanosoma congolense IL3000]CCD12250.1 unnamed protein product [Trypanosoma congolense IL3000]